MPRRLRLARVFGTLAALIVITSARSAGAQQSPTQQGEVHASISILAGQLGVKFTATEDDVLQMGGSFTGTLDQPDKLAALGIHGMHAGARVSVTRIAPDRFRVEADEVQPTEARAATTVRLTEGGTLIPVTKR